MRYPFIIFIFMLFALGAKAQILAQEIDSLRESIQPQDSSGLLSTLNYKSFSKLDSIAKHKLEYADSLKGKLTIAKNKIQNKKESLDSIKRKKLAVVDSATQKYEALNHKVAQKRDHLTDSIQDISTKYQTLLRKKTSLAGVTDSLRANVPDANISHSLDSINGLKSGVVESAKKPKALLDKTQSKIETLEKKPTEKINEKLALLSKEGEGQGNLPGNASLPGIDLSKANIIPDDIKLPQSGLKLDSKLPSLNQPTLPSVNENLTGKIPANKMDLPTDLVKTNDIEALTKNVNTDKVLNKTEDLSKMTGKVQGYTKDVKNIKEGELSKVKTLKEDALTKIPVTEQLTELQKQDQLAKEQKAKLESFRNPEAYKKKTLARGKQLAAAQMALYGQQVQQAVSSVSKYQSKLGTVLSKTSELSKKRDKLKRLKTYEKFIPGVTFQIYKSAGMLTDVNPSLRYRLTSYWSIGTGWNERVNLRKQNLAYDQTRIFGVRSFTEVVIFKGISFRIDVERMNAMISSLLHPQEDRHRVHVWNSMVGLKKDFTFISRVTGNAQFMYSTYSTDVRVLYPSKFNVRFGFEYLPKKRLKKR